MPPNCVLGHANHYILPHNDGANQVTVALRAIHDRAVESVANVPVFEPASTRKTKGVLSLTNSPSDSGEGQY